MHWRVGPLWTSALLACLVALTVSSMMASGFFEAGEPEAGGKEPWRENAVLAAVASMAVVNLLLAIPFVNVMEDRAAIKKIVLGRRDALPVNKWEAVTVFDSARSHARKNRGHAATAARRR